MEINKINDTLWNITYNVFDFDKSIPTDETKVVRINPNEVYYIEPHNINGQILYNYELPSGIFDITPSDAVELAFEINKSCNDCLIEVNPSMFSDDYFEGFWINLKQISWIIEGKAYLSENIDDTSNCMYVHFHNFQYKVLDIVRGKYIKKLLKYTCTTR